MKKIFISLKIPLTNPKKLIAYKGAEQIAFMDFTQNAAMEFDLPARRSARKGRTVNEAFRHRGIGKKRS